MHIIPIIVTSNILVTPENLRFWLIFILQECVGTVFALVDAQHREHLGMMWALNRLKTYKIVKILSYNLIIIIIILGAFSVAWWRWLRAAPLTWPPSTRRYQLLTCREHPTSRYQLNTSTSTLCVYMCVCASDRYCWQNWLEINL